ncbi:MAG: class I SAM-dependent methyltransferase [Fluviicola sp. XM-24bin1]|nr:MAG: class I SAM-dependent methyltransferase [Fluviicola sp. XM-24bin1]
MKQIRELGNVDIYVIDQLMKGAIRSDQKILDAGCGSGRNFSYLAKHNFNITGIDPNEEHIRNLQQQFPEYKNHLHISSIEEFQTELSFDYIICSAVLHFAENHNHFNQMFERLASLLSKDGTLFIRMTTDQGLPGNYQNETGVFNLPDGSTRYLTNRTQLSELLKEYNLKLAEPFKTVLVENWRSMATIVMTK